MGKKAVVFAGGGAKGSYQIGVWRALREADFEPDIVTGTSVGSLNAAMMVQGDLELSEKLWISIDTGSVLEWDASDPGDRLARAGAFAKEIARHGGFGYAPLKTMMLEHVNEARIRKSNIELGIVSVKYPTMQPVFMYTRDIPKGMLVDYLLASAACFPMMKTYEIDGQKYVDGGYYENMPINMALEHGAQEIIAVDLQAIGRKQSPSKQALASAQLHIIKSDFDLGALLIFNADTARFNMRLGYLDCMRTLSRLEGARFAFNPGAASYFSAHYAHIIQKKLAELGIFLDKAPQSAAEKMARMSFARYIRKHWGRALDEQGMTLALAEAAGDVLGLDPLTVYTHDAFIEAISKHQPHPSDKALLKVEYWLRKPEFGRTQLGELAEAASQLRPQHAAAFTLSRLHEPALTDFMRAEQMLLCTLLPREFAAALFLYALESSNDF